MDREEPVLPESLGRAAVGLIVVTISVFVWGCTVAPSSLPGTYRVDYGYGIEQLTLHADGTYVQQFAEKNKESRVINTGRWELERRGFWDGDLLNLFEPVIVDVFGKPSDLRPRPGLWALNIKKTWSGQPQLSINEDRGLAFDRMK